MTTTVDRDQTPVDRAPYQTLVDEVRTHIANDRPLDALAEYFTSPLCASKVDPMPRVLDAFQALGPKRGTFRAWFADRHEHVIMATYLTYANGWPTQYQPLEADVEFTRSGVLFGLRGNYRYRSAKVVAVSDDAIVISYSNTGDVVLFVDLTK